MSQENVEMVRRAVAAFNARDLEGYLACCTEDVDLHTPMEAVAGTYEGRAGIQRYLTDIEDAGPDFHIDLRDLEAIGDAQVLTFVQVSSTGRASGIPIATEATTVYDLIDGKISRVRVFLDRHEALKAVGLEEQAVSQENVELLRKGVNAWNQRDVDLWLAHAAPDVEWIPAGPAAVERTIYQGYDEVRDGITAIWDTWDVFECHESQVRDLGDSTLWLGHVSMRGSTSGVELNQEFAIHSVVRDGKFVLVHTFLSWQEGREAVGLEE